MESLAIENSNEKSDIQENENVRRQSKVCLTGRWRPSEDEKLEQLVAQYGPQNWNAIAEKLGGRTGKSCRLRWHNQLDPMINKRAFSKEEEERLLAVHRVIGNKWALIAKKISNRYTNSFLPCSGRVSNPTPPDSCWGSKNGNFMARNDSIFTDFNRFHPYPSSLVMKMKNDFLQISCTEPSPSPPVAENTDASHLSSTTPPPFIDFLGVGAI
ncbi:Transcription factor MYB44 [Olea europaea subsp. europaea]|uniref:Transcription factor MYB44 n=1 Tax=Olea europaea subsp. europaea TaxID=158383 RepID=A0A8S0UDF0_OLEEU|nr:Transcription factor MYB44 [Olea europaea subsp. europaea]